MRTKVTDQGVVVPKEFFESAVEVEIRKENGTVVLCPVEQTDPILGLGSKPVTSGLDDAADNHDRYLTRNAE